MVGVTERVRPWQNWKKILINLQNEHVIGILICMQKNVKNHILISSIIS